MKNIKLSIQFFACLLLFTLTACNKNNDEMDIVPPPSSESVIFSYTFDAENANKVIFTAQPNVETWYTHWKFGDNTSAEGVSAEKIYFLKGEYEIRFKIFTEGGTAETVQTISIAKDIIRPNLIQNGELEGDDGWTVLPIGGGADVTFENGTAVWTGGDWGQVGIYQKLQIEANTEYQINMDVSGSGMSDCWFEVYVGTAVPTAGVDYTDGGVRLGLNTWDGCGSQPFQGQLTELTCSNGGGRGTFEFATAVTGYLVIRSGGADLGTDGVTVDNVSVRPL